MLNIDQYAYSSKLKPKDPLEKLVFALMTMGVCLWANWVCVSIAVLLIMGWVSVRKGGAPFPVFIRLMLVPASFLTFGALTISFVFSGNFQELVCAIPIFQMYLGVSKARLMIAAGLVCKALGTVSCLYFLALTTPVIDLLAAFRRLKCPALFVELMGLIYRFIFVLLDMAATMFTAQISRLGYSSITSGYRSLSDLTATLFVRAYMRSDELYTALEARGYQGELNVLPEPYQKHGSGYFYAIIINAFLVVMTLLVRWYAGGFFG